MKTTPCKQTRADPTMLITMTRETAFQKFIPNNRIITPTNSLPFFYAQVIFHAETVVSNKDIASHRSLLPVRRNYINTQLPCSTSPREPQEELNALMIASQTP